jgi:3'-5' exoribonuclease
MSEKIDELKEMAIRLGVDKVCNQLLNDHYFSIWSGSGKEHQHHYGRGGLLDHTHEVVKLCFLNKNYLPDLDIDDKELFMSALFHDAGKLRDYYPKDDYYLHWAKSTHNRLIHHISRSALMWSEMVKIDKVLNDVYHDKVLHAILSHHGERERGSPVAPLSRVAWLVHLCDGISARMYDADTWDIIKE